MGPDANTSLQAIRRTRIVYVLLAIVFAIFILRAFYLQVIKYNYYHQAALTDQLKEYEIPAERGKIKARH